MNILSESLEKTYDLARDYIATLTPASHATVLAFTGDLGSGKTAFTQGVARALGVTTDITSPTFVIEKIYKLEGQAFEHLVHIDAYRLASGKELSHLGWEELLANPKNLIVVEWPELVADVMPEYARKLTFAFIDESTRSISW